MKTAWQSDHIHKMANKPTTAGGGHSHDLAEVVAELAKVNAALSALSARVAKLESGAPVARAFA